LNVISHNVPSRFTCAHNSVDSALTTLRTHAVEPSGRLVVALLELPAGMKHGENHLERALLRRRMLVDRNPAAVIAHRDRAAVFVQRDDDVRREAVHRLVNGVIENLPDQVVEAGGADAADVHARAVYEPDRVPRER
jgi:hypothetical protein